MQFLYISTLKKIKSILPKKEKSHAAQLFQNFFFSFFGIYFPFWNFFSVFFSTLLNVKLNFDELLRTMCNIFPPFFKTQSRAFFQLFEKPNFKKWVLKYFCTIKIARKTRQFFVPLVSKNFPLIPPYSQWLQYYPFDAIHTYDDIRKNIMWDF